MLSRILAFHAPPMDQRVPLEEDDFVVIPSTETDILISDLPEEVLLHIFSFLGPKVVGKVAATCKVWGAVASDDLLWSYFYKEAKRAKKLEALKTKSTESWASWLEKKASSDLAHKSPTSNVPWKHRYRQTFHIRKGFLWGIGGGSDGVDLALEQHTFPCDEGGLITGELVVCVASAKLVTHGIYLCVTGNERVYRRKSDMSEKETFVRSKVLLTEYFPVLGALPWDKKKEQKLILNNGTHRMNFSVPMPTTDKEGVQLPESFARTDKNHMQWHIKISYSVSAVMVLPWPYWNIQSDAYPLTLLPYSEEKQLRVLDEIERIKQAYTQTISKEIFFKGSVDFAISLEKQSFMLDDGMTINIEIETKDVMNVVNSVWNFFERKKTETVLDSLTVSIQEQFVWEEFGWNERRERCSHSYPLTIKNEKVSFPLGYQLPSEILGGPSLRFPRNIRQQYYLVVSLKVPFPYVSPEITVPITLLPPLRKPATLAL